MPSYQVVHDIFDHATDASANGPHEFPAHPPSFGLTRRDEPSRWQPVRGILDRDSDIRLLIVGRHGQGIHNLGQIKYGLERWSKEMCFQHGDSELTWGPDPPLSELGEEQAASVRSAWREELDCVPPIPTPSAFYVSPLRRTAQTLSITFRGLIDIDRRVCVRENLREKLDAHTPDQRMNLSVMRGEHPTWPVERGAEEEDVYWKKDWVESFEVYSARAGVVIDEIFSRDDQCVSITAHEGIIQGLLGFINHPVAQPPPGCAFGVLVRKVQ